MIVNLAAAYILSCLIVTDRNEQLKLNRQPIGVVLDIRDSGKRELQNFCISCSSY